MIRRGKWRVGSAIALLTISGVFAFPPGAGADDAEAQPPAYSEADLRDFLERHPRFAREEAAEYLGRTGEINHLNAALREQHGDVFAGLWRDPSKATADVWIGITRSDAAIGRFIARNFHDMSRVRIVRQSFTDVELRGAVDRIWSTLGESALAERIVYVGLDAQQNSVQVAISGPVTPPDEDEIRQASAGIPVLIVPQESLKPADCTSRRHCTPEIRGGIQIFNTDAICSAGFVGKSLATGSPVMITAGHCFPLGRDVLHGAIGEVAHDTPKLLGQVENRRFGGNVDGETVVYTEGLLGWTTRRWVYAADNDRAQPIGTVEKRHFTAAVGDFICKGGRTTGRTCGNITQVGVPVTVGGVSLTDQVVADLCARRGDSGGPVHIGGKGYGVVSGASPADPAIPCRATDITSWSRLANIEASVRANVKTTD